MRSDEDFDAVIGLLYDAALEPSQWTMFLERLADSLGAVQGTMMMIDVAQPENAVVRVTRFDPAAETEFRRRRHEEDIWWRRLPGAATGECFTGSDLVDTRDFLATPLARDVGRTTDVAFMLGGWFQKSGDLLGVVSVLRGRSADDFSDSHRVLLGRILPHLHRAMAMHRRFAGLTAREQEFEAGLNGLSEAIFLVLDDGRVRFCNSAAQTMVRDQCGVRIRNNRLAFEDHTAHLELERALRDHGSARSSTTGHLWVRRKSPATPLVVRVFPISNTRAEMLGFPHQQVSAVVISEPGQQRPPPVGLLMGFYGLTRAEASVASAVAAGKRLTEIAALEGKSIHTVRAQLKACFARLAVRSQAELVRRLGALIR